MIMPVDSFMWHYERFIYTLETNLNYEHAYIYLNKTLILWLVKYFLWKSRTYAKGRLTDKLKKKKNRVVTDLENIEISGDFVDLEISVIFFIFIICSPQ